MQSDGPEVPGSRRTARSPSGWRDRELESASRDLRDASPDSRRRIKADYDNAFLNDRPTSEDEMDDGMAAEAEKSATAATVAPDSVPAAATSSQADPAPMEVDEGSTRYHSYISSRISDRIQARRRARMAIHRRESVEILAGDHILGITIKLAV